MSSKVYIRTHKTTCTYSITVCVLKGFQETEIQSGVGMIYYTLPHCPGRGAPRCSWVHRGAPQRNFRNTVQPRRVWSQDPMKLIVCTHYSGILKNWNPFWCVWSAPQYDVSAKISTLTKSFIFGWLRCTPTDFMVSPVYPVDRGSTPVTPGSTPLR